MNKKLIALAVAGAFAAPVAMADTGNVTIYGKMELSYDLMKTGDAASGAPGVSTNQVSSNASRIGFKGNEDLGNGLSAVWQLEQGIAADGQSTAAFGGDTLRNTFIGLAGKSWGTVLMGHHDTPYKMSTRGLDSFGDGIADNRNLMGGVKGGVSSVAQFDGRDSNVVAYMSPDFSGFKGSVAYVAGAESAVSGNTKGDAWSAAGTYDNGPLYAALAYEKHNFGSATAGPPATTSGDLGAVGYAGQEEHAWKLGAGYKIDAFKVGAVYETTKDNLGTGGADNFGHHAYTLDGSYTMGNNVLKAAYTRAGDLAKSSNTSASQWAIGVDHNFSKRTTLYALYTKLNNDSGINYKLGVGGGTTLVDSSPGAGADPSAFAVGMVHRF